MIYSICQSWNEKKNRTFCEQVNMLPLNAEEEQKGYNDDDDDDNDGAQKLLLMTAMLQ